MVHGVPIRPNTTTVLRDDSSWERMSLGSFVPGNESTKRLHFRSRKRKCMGTKRPEARVFSSKKRSIAVRKKPHRYWNSRAIWDHTVLPATRQRWYSRLHPSRSGTRLSDPGGMQGWVDLVGWLQPEIWYTRPKTVTHPSCNRARRALTSFINELR